MLSSFHKSKAALIAQLKSERRPGDFDAAKEKATDALYDMIYTQGYLDCCKHRESDLQAIREKELQALPPMIRATLSTPSPSVKG